MKLLSFLPGLSFITLSTFVFSLFSFIIFVRSAVCTFLLKVLCCSSCFSSGFSRRKTRCNQRFTLILIQQIVGPFANDSTEITGTYNPVPSPGMIVTALEGLRSMASVVQYAAGCPVTTCRKVDTDSVRRAVTGTDVNFVMIGTGEVGCLLLLQGGKHSLLLVCFSLGFLIGC